MSPERVALTPQCAECGKVWLPADQKRWQAWLTCDEPPEVAFYCPDYADREFGSDPIPLGSKGAASCSDGEAKARQRGRRS